MNYYLFILAIFGPGMFILIINKLDKEIAYSINQTAQEAYTKGCYNGTLASKQYKRFLTSSEVKKCKADAITYRDALKHSVNN